MVFVETAGSVINGVDHDDSTAGYADRVQDRRQGLGKQFATKVLAMEFLGESESGQEEAWNYVRSAATHRGGDFLATNAVGDDGVVTDDPLVVIQPQVHARRPGAIGRYGRVPKPGVEIAVS
jgi:hypothetical protein